MNRFVRDVVGLGGGPACIPESQDEDSGTRTIFGQEDKKWLSCVNSLVRGLFSPRGDRVRK